jgi:UDP-glucose 4-epimerase
LRIFITGGNGYLGSRLAVYLKNQGHEIIIGVRNSIEVLTWNVGMEILVLDWENLALIEKKLKDVEVIFHTAGVNASNAQSNPEYALYFNGLKTLELVNIAKKSGVSYFYYFSTAHIYGNPLEGKLTEKTCPKNYHPYATSNIAGENAVLTANQPGVFNGIVLRISNTFGIPVHDKVDCWSLLVNDLCRQAVKERKLVLKTDGKQYRDFISISSFCLLINELLQISNLQIYPPVFNVGSGMSISVYGMARRVQQRCNYLFGYKPEILINNYLEERSKPRKFKFNLENLGRLNINFIENINVEIDDLLLYCKQNS